MGLIYNVTIKVEKRIADEWLRWMVQEHAPQIVATKCFTKFTALKLLEYDDEESSTYAVQYFADKVEDYKTYINQFADHFRKQSFDKWGDRLVAFRTVMEIVH
jgi:hypothetical protein